MAQEFPIPKWAKDRATFMRINVAIAAALTALVVAVAVLTPTFLRLSLGALFSPFLLFGLVSALVLVGGIRRIVLGPARNQEMRAGVLLAVYVLAAVPLAMVALLLGALATVALVSGWQPGFNVVQSFLLLLAGWTVFVLTVKTFLNAQMLMRHWLGR